MVSIPNTAPSVSAASRAPMPSSTATTTAHPRIKSNGIAIPNAKTPLSARRAQPLDLSQVETKQQPRLPKQAHIPAVRKHIAGVRDCPTFRPTEEEWRDPMEYMKKIADEGKKYGICKIVPPENWNPTFAIDMERFHFRTRKQELNFVEGGNDPVWAPSENRRTNEPPGSRAHLEYLEKLNKFHKSRGITMHRYPSVDKRPLDLYELKKAVESRGGFEAVCKGKKWAEIGRILGYSGKIMSSLSTSLKNSYQKWLDPYEKYVAGHGPTVRMHLEQERSGPYDTPSPGPSPARMSHQHTPSNLVRDSPAIRASDALNGSMIETQQPGPPPTHNEAFPPRPSSGFTAVNAAGSGGFTPANARPSPSGLPPSASQSQPRPASSGFMSVNQSNHIKPEGDSRQQTPSGYPSGYPPVPPPMAPLIPDGYGPAISTAAKRRLPDLSDDEVDDSDSAAARKYSKRAKNDAALAAPRIMGSQMMQPRSSTPKPLVSRANMRVGDYCEECGATHDKKGFLTCSGCDSTYHLSCLDHSARENPQAHDWHCPKCLVGTGDYGFEEGGIYSLKDFWHKAAEFKRKHFQSRQVYDPVWEAMRPITEDEVEEEFWKLVTHKEKTVEVEYGADIHSTTHGSGFPTLERNPRDEYSADPWNLNVLPLNGESLFRYIRSDISGMTVPWLYVGMVFSTFCWHNEDHYAYSANYQHLGATKTWYGIPGHMADKFEAAMKEAVPDLFESQPDLLFQLVTLLSPEQLKKSGVDVYACDQRAGEFVVTFPKAYHAGFNHGFNFNEAVNFAPADWESEGDEGIQRLRSFRRQPCFSHDMLLLTAAASKDMPIKTAKWLSPALKRLYDRELAARGFFNSRVEDTGLLKPKDESEQRLAFTHIVDQDDLPEEDYTCAFCKGYAYLSRFTCQNNKVTVCLDHVPLINCCASVEGHQLHHRFTSQKLAGTVNKIVDKASQPEAWTAKFEASVKDVANPPLKVLRSLLAEGEKIPWSIPEIDDLKAFVEQCQTWIDDANIYITRKQQSRRKSESANKRKGSKADTQDREERNLKNIKKLLDDAEGIGFDCPEIGNLKDRAHEIADYQKRARSALRGIALKSSEEVEELINEGKQLVVDVPETESLEKVIRQMRWHEAASERPRPMNKSLQEVMDLIAQADELGVPEYNDHLHWLKDQRDQGELWEEKAKELISVENVHFSQLNTFSLQAADIPVTKETLASIDAILRKQREAQEQVMSLVERSKDAEYSKRPMYAEACKAMEAVSQLQSKPQGTIDLEKEQRRHEDWMRRGKKLFGKSNAPLHILHQHLQIIDSRNKGCFDLDDKPRIPVEPSSRANSPEAHVEVKQSGSQRDVFCLCRKPEAGMMIECSKCREWYHSKCLKIARGKIKEDDDFTCPICDYRVKIPRDAERPKLEQMIDLYDQIQSLPFQPDEEPTIHSIITTAQAFREHVQQFMGEHMKQASEIPQLRFYLRKIEGADVLLCEETNFFRRTLHDLFPIAPQPPPDIQISHSTRKPRPTKQQKLMAQFGVENPDDLPAEYKTKQYGGKKRKSDALNGEDKSKATSQDSRASSAAPKESKPREGPQTLNFRQPLTASTFPHKPARQGESGESPLFSQASAGANVAGGPRLASPFASTSPEATHHEPGGLFGNTDQSPGQDRPGTGHQRNLSSHTQNGTMFDAVPAGGDGLDRGGSREPDLFGDSIFHELTNDDQNSSPNQPKESGDSRLGGGEVDRSLLNEALFGGS